jgi:cell shape-determining protein MreC
MYMSKTVRDSTVTNPTQINRQITSFSAESMGLDRGNTMNEIQVEMMKNEHLEEIEELKREHQEEFRSLREENEQLKRENLELGEEIK